VQVFFKDGSSTPKVSIDYPIGHRRRREEGIPVLMAKCGAALRGHLPADQADRIMDLAADPAALDKMPIHQFMNLYRV
jgi:2-methylcitrate dehydratase